MIPGTLTERIPTQQAQSSGVVLSNHHMAKVDSLGQQQSGQQQYSNIQGAGAYSHLPSNSVHRSHSFTTGYSSEQHQLHHDCTGN